MKKTKKVDLDKQWYLKCLKEMEDKFGDYEKEEREEQEMNVLLFHKLEIVLKYDLELHKKQLIVNIIYFILIICCFIISLIAFFK